MNYLKMKKTIAILTLLVASLMSFAAKAQTAPPGDWRLHNTFHYYHKKIVDTPDKVYLLSYGLGYWNWSTSYGSEFPILFVYDKKNDEIEGYNAKNYLHGNIIKDLWYNAAGKYFLIVYDDYNMDLLYTDDRCYNVPGLASAIIPGGKEVNSVSFDTETNRAYLATQFGFMVVDGDKSVIAESHLYGKNLKSVARVGDYLLAAADDGLYYAPLKSNSKHNSWSEFKKFSNSPSSVNKILPLKGNSFLYLNNRPNLVSIAEDGVLSEPQEIYASGVKEYYPVNQGGYFMATEWEGILVDQDGNLTNLPGTSAFRNDLYGASSSDMLYRVESREGIDFRKKISDEWVNTPSGNYGKYIKPNAPNVFDSGSFDWSDKHGMVTTNACYTHWHGSTDANFFSLVSSYNNGTWKAVTPSISTGVKGVFASTHPGVLEPYDDDLVWFGHASNGLGRYNISENSGKNFTVEGKGSRYNVQTPKFSDDGTLWTVFGGNSRVGYWPKDARLSGDASAFKPIPVVGFSSGSFPVFQPCNSQGASNFIVMASGQYDSNWTVLDHNGTPDNTSDDRVIHLSNPVDQDGQPISINYTYCMAEDPETGRIWVGGDGGLFWFNPAEVFNPNFHVNRVKVARNDGTGLADYLLEGASVFCIGIDGAGHKWFGTLGNGIVETSASGSEIIRQLTRENSYLPCNDVISVGFEPNSNCVWIGTKQGVAQYYSETIAGADKLDDVLAYPNPVRPDYYGQVTIKGLMDGTLVKILDASGGLVRELGRSEGGMMLWDLTNMGGRRVPTGVYYVATSTSGDSSEANVAKILVMN